MFFSILPSSQELTTTGNQTHIKVYSPNPAPYVYTNSSVDITIDYIVPVNWTQMGSFYYTLNGGTLHELYCHTNIESDLLFYHLNWLLENLPDGNHKLEVFGRSTNGAFTITIYDDTFTVDRAFKPTPTPTQTPLPPTPTATHPKDLEFDATVFGTTAALVIVTVIAAIALFVLEKHRP